MLGTPSKNKDHGGELGLMISKLSQPCGDRIIVNVDPSRNGCFVGLVP